MPPGHRFEGVGGHHPMPELGRHNFSRDPYPSTEMLRLAEDGVMFKIARFEKQVHF
jgi:hypothetical protein